MADKQTIIDGGVCLNCGAKTKKHILICDKCTEEMGTVIAHKFTIDKQTKEIKQLNKQLKRKEQEYEELKSVRDSWISKCEQETKIKELYQDGLDQLKQSIARVKELIQKEINDCEHCDDCTSCGYNCCLRQAMQICDEVISE